MRCKSSSAIGGWLDSATGPWNGCGAVSRTGKCRPCASARRRRRTYRALLDRPQADLRDRRGIDCPARVEERKIPAVEPQRREIAIMRASRVPRLPGRIDGTRVVPATHIDHHAKRRTALGLKAGGAILEYFGRVAAALG